MPSSPTALLFELSGCLVDFGARTLPVALQRLYPECSTTTPVDTPQQALEASLGRAATPAQLQALRETLSEVAGEHTELAPGAERLLNDLADGGVPCAWLDRLPSDASLRLAEALPDSVLAALPQQARAWPAPDSCWQALTQLGVERLDGCILVSGNPLLLQAGLNAGCWTIGLAACGPLCGHAPADWQALAGNEQERLRAEATLRLYRLGAHSVVDHLGEIAASLDDIGMRRSKGERP
ncbi:Phosphonoacetaldehyde hydrolase [Pseudomonas sp. THAF187a]|uniref:HAD family phosphatase n=1 Tax=unclassified Pseudomonas TaxID=196821 RepID=UPI001267A2CE|nr:MULTISPECIES: HAD family phosphatase [unclassified Pseudomonas]QFT22810.1 Phosphonoacetaldehyde hydrolase [Pseudomonas sp. THAF187a]QFT42997.1 Phosphonoacetaldehyde hydrolase [Pseudomonas sp. THAF42]